MVDKKASTTVDMEEKMTPTDLDEMMTNIVKRMKISKATEEAEAKRKEETEQERIRDAEAQASDGGSDERCQCFRKVGAVDRWWNGN